MTRESNRVARKNNISTRLARLVSLRKSNAPMWVIKSEQVALYLNSKGMKHGGIGKPSSKLQNDLYQKFVVPYLANSIDD